MRRHPNILDMMRHHLNPLHLYCKLTKLGFNNNFSLKVSRVYEKLYKRALIGSSQDKK